MSLNKFTDPAILDNESKKPWMNINCNAVNGTEMYRNGVPLIPQPPYQLWSSIAPVATVNQNVINMTGSFIGSQTIPLNQMYTGKTIQLYAAGNNLLTGGLNGAKAQMYVGDLANTTLYGQEIVTGQNGASNNYKWTLLVTIVVKSILTNLAVLNVTYHYTTSQAGTDPAETTITVASSSIDITNGFSLALWGGIAGFAGGGANITPLIICASSIY